MFALNSVSHFFFSMPSLCLGRPLEVHSEVRRKLKTMLLKRRRSYFVIVMKSIGKTQEAAL